MILKSFLYNSVRVRHVPWHGQDVHPDTGIAFYVNNGHGGVIGVRVYSDGHKELSNATCCKHENSNKNYCRGQKPYLQFKDAWGRNKAILASHAIYTAWRNKPIPEGMTIDHIDGCTTNNDYRNLRCVSGAINSRDGGFLRKLKKAGFDPTSIPRPILLRYFTRMAKWKAEHTASEYKNISKTDLTHILYESNHILLLSVA